MNALGTTISFHPNGPRDQVVRMDRETFDEYRGYLERKLELEKEVLPGLNQELRQCEINLRKSGAGTWRDRNEVLGGLALAAVGAGALLGYMMAK